MTKRSNVSRRTLQRKVNRQRGFMAVTRHKIRIADLNVMENENVPEGVMIVHPKEADRLNQLIVDATNRKATERATSDGYDETDPKYKVSLAHVAELITKLEEAGQTVTPETHVIYASSKAVFETDYSDYKLDIITNDNLGEGVMVVVGEKVSK